MMNAEANVSRSSERVDYACDRAKNLDGGTLGGKGAGFVQMKAAGLRIPPGLVIQTDRYKTGCRSRLPSFIRQRGFRNFGVETSERIAARLSLAGLARSTS